MPYIDDADLKTFLAGELKLTSENDVEYPDESITAANGNGHQAILRALLGRGFTQAQIDAWDSRVEFNRDIATFFCLRGMGNLTDTDLWINKYDRRLELETVPILSGGVLIDPGGTIEVDYGVFDDCDDTFTMDVNW